MKLYNNFFATLAVCVVSLGITACNDYDYDTQLARTDITGPFTL